MKIPLGQPRFARAAKAEGADVRRLRKLVDNGFVRVQDYVKHEFLRAGR
jgi:hypothetical protein